MLDPLLAQERPRRGRRHLLQSLQHVVRQIENYAEFNKEFKPKGLEVEFVNPGMEVLDKVTTMHVAGTPADMWETPNLWRQMEGLVAEITPFLTRDKVDEKQWLPDAI